MVVPHPSPPPQHRCSIRSGGSSRRRGSPHDTAVTSDGAPRHVIARAAPCVCGRRRSSSGRNLALHYARISMNNALQVSLLLVDRHEMEGAALRIRGVGAAVPVDLGVRRSTPLSSVEQHDVALQTRREDRALACECILDFVVISSRVIAPPCASGAALVGHRSNAVRPAESRAARTTDARTMMQCVSDARDSGRLGPLHPRELQSCGIGFPGRSAPIRARCTRHACYHTLYSCTVHKSVRAHGDLMIIARAPRPLPCHSRGLPSTSPQPLPPGSARRERRLRPSRAPVPPFGHALRAAPPHTRARTGRCYRQSTSCDRAPS